MKAPQHPVLTHWLFVIACACCSSCTRDDNRPSPEMSGRADGSRTSDAAGAGGSSTASYADVTAVQVTGSPSAYQFAVSIESADLDCTQYANWWEVLSRDGTLLYRRILEHSHTDENGTSDPDAPGNTFTRDGGPVDIESETNVIVRAHMSDAGYSGRAMQGSPSAGFTAATELPRDFGAGVEREMPQPAGCAF